MRVHIHSPRSDVQERKIRQCFTERIRRRHILHHTEYYGWQMWCCGCGDTWQNDGDGWQRAERPFERAWRKNAIIRAKKLWNQSSVN